MARARPENLWRKRRKEAQTESWLLRYPLGTGDAADWSAAACHDQTSLMFDGRRQFAAMQLCQSCPLRLACLQAAYRIERDQGSHEIFGVRGGIVAIERIRWLQRNRYAGPGRATPHAVAS